MNVKKGKKKQAKNKTNDIRCEVDGQDYSELNMNDGKVWGVFFSQFLYKAHAHAH